MQPGLEQRDASVAQSDDSRTRGFPLGPIGRGGDRGADHALTEPDAGPCETGQVLGEAFAIVFRIARRGEPGEAEHEQKNGRDSDEPSACFVDNDSQKSSILSEKPYSNFYEPSDALLSKIKNERNIRIEGAGNLVYLCYRYKKVDPKIDERTMAEAKKCRRDNIEIDTIVVSEETDLLYYVQQMEKQLRGRTYHINQNNMDRVLVMDYLHNHKKLLASKTT